MKTAFGRTSLVFAIVLGWLNVLLWTLGVIPMMAGAVSVLLGTELMRRWPPR
jgi:hypothetical protein